MRKELGNLYDRFFRTSSERRLIAIKHQHKSFVKYIVVNWAFTNVCNYECSYCPEFLHNSSVKFLPFESVKKFCIRAIEEAKKNDKKIFFEFSGGEVTLYPRFEELADCINTYGGFIGVISNGSWQLDWWKKVGKKLNSVILSFHVEYQKIDHFVSAVKYLASLPSLRLHVNIMMVPERFDECLRVAKLVKKEAICSIALQHLLEDLSKRNDEMYPYTDEQLKIMTEFKGRWYLKSTVKKIIGLWKPEGVECRLGIIKVFDDGYKERTSSAKLISRNENNWKGWECYAGVENFAIDQYGAIYRGWCGVGGKIGSIHEDQPPFSLSPVVCDKDYCHCGFDINSTKKKIS